MFTTRLSRILLAGLVCLLVLPLFSLSAWADEQSETQFLCPPKKARMRLSPDGCTIMPVSFWWSRTSKGLPLYE